MSDSWPPRWAHGDQGEESMPQEIEPATQTARINGELPPYKGPQASYLVGAKAHKSTEPDLINNAPHYTYGGLQPIDMIEAKQLGFHLGNALKYVCRCQYKGNRKADVEKAIWYLQRYLKTIETEQ